MYLPLGVCVCGLTSASSTGHGSTVQQHPRLGELSAGSGRYNVPPTQLRSLQASGGLFIVRFWHRLPRSPNVPWWCLVETEAAEHPGRRLSGRRTGLITLETPFRYFRSGNPPAARGAVRRQGALLPGDRALSVPKESRPLRVARYNSHRHYTIG